MRLGAAVEGGGRLEVRPVGRAGVAADLADVDNVYDELNERRRQQRAWQEAGGRR